MSNKRCFRKLMINGEIELSEGMYSGAEYKKFQKYQWRQMHIADTALHQQPEGWLSDEWFLVLDHREQLLKWCCFKVDDLYDILLHPFSLSYRIAQRLIEAEDGKRPPFIFTPKKQ